MRFKTYAREFPGALFLAVTTAVVTLLLALMLSILLGGESRSQQAATRCYAAATVNMLRDAPWRTRSDYPYINTEGIDCDRYLSEPASE